MTETTPTPTAEQKAKAIMFAVGAGVAVLLVVLCLGGMLWNAIFGAEPNGAGASTACRGFVEDQLRYPASAEFSRLSLTGEGRRWTVTGTVDADNSFGAPVRMNFRCTVDGEGSSWTLISLTGLDR